MNKRTYSEKLRDPRWQQRRLGILSKSKFRCANCDDSESELHVHHLLYERGKEPWEYEDKLLLSLCSDCHKKVDRCQKDIVRLLAELPPEFLFDLLPALNAILTASRHPFVAWSRWMDLANRKPLRKAS